MIKRLIGFVCVMAAICLRAGIVVPLPSGDLMRLYSGYSALVIGNSDYKHFPRLKGVKKDIQDVAKLFTKLGIPCEIKENLNAEQMLAALYQFVELKGSDPDLGLILYYAGHGYTEETYDGSSVGYIVPVDAPLYRKDKNLFRQRSISMNKIKEMATIIRSKHVLMIFDSCFAGTVFRGDPALPTEIDEKVSQPVRQFITAGDENEEVPDVSIFKATLLKALGDGLADLNQDGFVTANELGHYLKSEVVNYSKGAQHPQYGKLYEPNYNRGDFVFALANPPRQKKLDPAPKNDPEPKVETQWLYGKLEIESNVDATLYLNGAEQSEILAGQRSNFELGVGDYTVELRTASSTQKKLATVRVDKLDRLSFEFDKSAAALNTPKKASQKQSTGPKVDTARTTPPKEFIRVGGGSFKRGCEQGYQDSKPVRDITVNSFYIYAREVTQRQWKEVMPNNPSAFPNDDKPVDSVSWFDAVDYCNRRSRKEGLNPCYVIDKAGSDGIGQNAEDQSDWKVSVNWNANGYRLPTELEWEYAARGGNQSRQSDYSGVGDLSQQAWHSQNSAALGKDHPDYGTHPVGTKDPNELGLYDMSGNVCEWVWDWYDAGYYAKASSVDPRGPASGTEKVLRGGSWLDYGPVSCHVAYRYSAKPMVSFQTFGFRVARSMK